LVSVELSDTALLGSFADFLTYKLQATVAACDGILEVEFVGAVFQPEVQAWVLERLLWAWWVERGIRGESSAVLRATTDEGDPGAAVTRRWTSAAR
jgi:hypothetical protein